MPETTISKLFGSGLGVFTGDRQAILSAPYGGLEKVEAIMIKRKLYTIKDMAEIMDLSQYKIRKWLKSQNIDFIKYKRKNHYLKITMDILIAEELKNDRENAGVNKCP